MRRVLYVGIIVLVAVAFAVAGLTQGKGPLFVASLVLAAGMLIALVFLAAFSGVRNPMRPSPRDDVGALEDAARFVTRAGWPGEIPGGAPGGAARGRPGAAASRRWAQSFVSVLVPVPVPPGGLLTPAARREFLEDLRREGRGLIRLAKITGADVSPYQAFLTDARKAALQGDSEATLRSLQLANELLRGTIEKFLMKRGKLGPGARDLEDL